MSHFHFGNNCGFGRLFSQCPAVLSEPNGQRADPNRQWYTIVIRTKAAPQNPRRMPHGEPCGAALLPAQQILEHFCLSKRRNTASEILDRRKPALRFLPCLAPFVRRINHSRFYWASSNVSDNNSQTSCQYVFEKSLKKWGLTIWKTLLIFSGGGGKIIL